MYEELEPILIADLLFEERAVDIFTHDKITESRQRRNQIKYLLETVRENGNECFHFFLFILQERIEYRYICDKLQNSMVAATGDNMLIKRSPVRYDLKTSTKGSIIMCIIIV